MYVSVRLYIYIYIKPILLSTLKYFIGSITHFYSDSCGSNKKLILIFISHFIPIHSNFSTFQLWRSKCTIIYLYRLTITFH